MEYVFDDKNFQQEVMEADKPVLVDFYADWCGPCRTMAPVIGQLAEEYGGRVKIGKLNVDKNPSTANAWQVMSIPTLILFKDGRPEERIVGVVGKDAVENVLDNYSE